MATFLIVLSSVLTIATAIPYILDILRGRTKPRIVSWATWTVLTGIATIATFSDGKVPAAMLMLAITVESLLVVILGWKYGDKKFARADNMTMAGALIGLALWFVFNSPAVAVAAIVAIEFIGMVPTAIHSWQKPLEETWITFIGAGTAAFCTLLTIQDFQITSALYPAYIFVSNISVGLIILLRGRRALEVR